MSFARKEFSTVANFCCMKLFIRLSKVNVRNYSEHSKIFNFLFLIIEFKSRHISKYIMQLISVENWPHFVLYFENVATERLSY